MHSVRRELPTIGEIWNVLWIHIALFVALEVLAIVRASTSSGGAAVIAIIATAYMALITIAIMVMRVPSTPQRRAVSAPAPLHSRHRAAHPRRVGRFARHIVASSTAPAHARSTAHAASDNRTRLSDATVRR
jgi:hypothetical protein